MFTAVILLIVSQSSGLCLYYKRMQNYREKSLVVEIKSDFNTV